MVMVNGSEHSSSSAATTSAGEKRAESNQAILNSTLLSSLQQTMQDMENRQKKASQELKNSETVPL